MANFPGPYEIEFNITGFTAPARDHLSRWNVIAVGSPAIGALPTAIDIQKKGGATAKLNVVANQLWEFIRLHYPVAITCTGYQLWRYVTGTYAKDFISTGSVTNPTGTTGSVQAAQQLTQTYRSANGGIMKVVLLETNTSGVTRQALVPNAAGTASQKLAAYLLSADGIGIARDDAFPINALTEARGENESLFRLINR